MLENLFKKTVYANNSKKDIQEDVILRLMFELAVSDGSLDTEELAMLKERALEISKDQLHL